MLVCKKCKSKDVDIQAWININDNKWTCDIDGMKPYCNECEEEAGVEDDKR